MAHSTIQLCETEIMETLKEHVSSLINYQGKVTEVRLENSDDGIVFEYDWEV